MAQADLEALVSQDASLQYDPEDDILVWTGHPSRKKIGFCFVSGRLESMTTPDKKTERKMEEIANSLGALLEGEDGARTGFDPLRIALRVMVGLLLLGLALIWLLKRLHPKAEFGSTDSFIGAGLLALVAGAVLVSALYPRPRGAAERRADFLRSEFSSVAASVGLLIMSIAMVVRGILDQHGPLAGVVLWLFCGGAFLLAILGPAYDFFRRRRG